MSYIFIDKDGEQGGGQSQMRQQMRSQMRSYRYGNRNYGGYRMHDGYRSYEDGYRDGYKHGYEDSEDDGNEEGYRRERDSRGRYM
jgi:hypothetical protein